MNKTKKSQSHEEQYSGHSGKLAGKSLPARIHHSAEWQLVSRSSMTNQAGTPGQDFKVRI